MTFINTTEKQETLALKIAEHAWKMDGTERDMILGHLESQIDNASFPVEKIQIYFDFLYCPPKINDLDWKDVSIHIRDKLKPFLDIVKELLPKFSWEMKTVIDHYGENETFNGLIFNGKAIGFGRYEDASKMWWWGYFYKDKKYGV